jgi:K+-transporting ATPase ATPase C chain
MKQLVTSFKFFLFLTLILGFAYPLTVTAIAYLFFHHQAHGSLIIADGKIRGSSLIGQKFQSDIYFWSRPSAGDYDPLRSGGSNLSPASLKLKTLVDQRASVFGGDVPSDLLFASGSGLDPHITLDAAHFQVDRIAKSRGVSVEALKQIIIDKTIMNQYVNVLELNLTLDEQFKGNKNEPR